MSTRTYATRPGSRHPTGARIVDDGVNFCVFSRHATSVELLLFATPDDLTPFQIIALDPDINRTFFFWHVFVEGLGAGVHYNWRVSGPHDTPRTGFRFNKNKLLLDPWARALTDHFWDRRRAAAPDDASQSAMRAIVVDTSYDWESDVPLNHPIEDSIIYELHVGGFTRHPSAGVRNPGTFDAIVEKVDYLKELGITDVELLPVMAFDEQDVSLGAAGRGLRNFWGYSTHSFYCPHPRYCVTPDAGTHLREFRDMVKALHSADIGVILDVVFNHTAEGNQHGPNINFKGLMNEVFYHLDPNDRSKYRDYTGCGNTVNCNHPLVTRFIIDCLAFWVRDMHVDGFRFDLASVFARGENGEPMYNAPLPWSIEFSRTLNHSTIIAEAWDAAGLYQVGAFPGFRWAEWNGHYRDVMRRFVRGDKGLVGDVATCVSGSSDLYGPQGRLPINSINFITCHDGYTLRDLVSYERKHNEANGEDNRDGHNDNLSWSGGEEGPTRDPVLAALRQQQAKNFMAILLISHGVPMILAGDEVLRTQHGNNNAYCQDNEIGWFDWQDVRRNQPMFRFTQQMIALRKRHPALRRTRFLTGRRVAGTTLADVTWHGPRLHEPLWGDPDAQILAYTLAGLAPGEEHLHIVLNMGDHGYDAPLPQIAERRWFRAVDTALGAPEDIVPPRLQPAVHGKRYPVQPRSVVILEARG